MLENDLKISYNRKALVRTRLKTDRSVPTHDLHELEEQSASKAPESAFLNGSGNQVDSEMQSNHVSFRYARPRQSEQAKSMNT
jgi:hypothetical protein